MEVKNTWKQIIFSVNGIEILGNPNGWKLDPDSYIMPQLNQDGL